MDLEKLAERQMELARRVVLKDRFQRLEHLAGVDVAYSGSRAYAAAVILSRGMELLETRIAESTVTFPYIPTFLSYREAEPMKAALRCLEGDYDVLLVNGHGIAHPRGLGLASHLGVILERPTVGVAGGLLCGEVTRRELEGARIVNYQGADVGFRTTHGGKKPLFISPGNLVSLNSSLKIVLGCMGGHALPEPLWHAHAAASGERAKHRG